MPYTQTDLDGLDAAIKTGALTIEYADKKVTYRSMSEMLQVRAAMLADLGLTQVDSGRVFASFDKGIL